jgi:tRNA-uridine 2-sulfurtransferase
MTQQRKAVSLISGGLDSMLATQLILEQGIHVEGLNFFTGFCVEGHTHAIRRQDKEKNKRNNALWVAEQLGIKLHIIDIVDEYKDIVINPKHGYGANLNPCLDCKVFMIRKAHQWLQENKFDFIITGEVIGQRPKSQRKATMPLIADKSGAQDRLLRPLCAQYLPQTLPEQAGWVDRTKLMAITGRGRKPQFELAQRFQFQDFAQPAGGCCFLTDKSYSEKLRDLWQYRGEKRYELDDIMLLKVGRHLRPRSNFKMIIGREEGENNFLEGYHKQVVHLRILSHMGPLILVEGILEQADFTLAAEIAARFSAGRDEPKVTVQIQNLDGSAMILNVTPMSSDEIPDEWYIA